MLPTRSLFCVALTLMSIAGSARASAQTSDTQSAAAQMDLFDVWRRMRHTPAPAAAEPYGGTGRMMVVTPVIGSNPSAGFTFGVASQLAVVRGDPRTTRISAGIASLTFSTRKQAMLNIRFALFTNENRWLVEGDNRFHSTSQDMYGLGTATPASSAVGADYGFVRLHETVYRRVTRGVWAGGGVLFDSHSNVGPAEGVEEEWPTSPYVTYSQSHDLPLEGQQSAGASANVLINTRDSDIEPRRGWYANAAYQMFGGDSTWQLLHFDMRTYLPLNKNRRHLLAVWLFGDMTTHGAPPYFDLPATVMDMYGRSARGYREGRFRGERLLYGEVEYRGTITRNGLLGMVAFANATTLTNLQAGDRLFDSVAPAAGAGLRALFNKRSRTRLCLDVAWGKTGSHGVYLAIQEAF
jgi:Omp85 superfamily domain